MYPYESWGLGDRYLVIHLFSKHLGPYCMPTATADTKDEIPSLGILIGTYQLGKD